MNFAQLKAALRVSIGNPSVADVPDLSPSGTGLGDYINDAYFELLDRFGHSTLKPRYRFTTISGTGKYILPNTVGGILWVWDRTNKIKLDRVDMDYISRNEFDAPSPATAKPTKYAHIDNFLQLLAIPDGAYVMEFMYRLITAGMALDVDVPSIPLTWHKGIRILARWHYYLDTNDTAKQTSSKAAYDLWLSTKPLETAEETMADDTGVSIPSLGSGRDARLDFDHST